MSRHKVWIYQKQQGEEKSFQMHHLSRCVEWQKSSLIYISIYADILFYGASTPKDIMRIRSLQDFLNPLGFKRKGKEKSKRIVLSKRMCRS